MQLTFDRFEGICSPQNVWVVTNLRYKDIVKEQLPEIPEGNILCEPCRRNTAPCIAYVSWRIKTQDKNANIVVTPSDHIVTDCEEFRRVVKQCLKFSSETDAMITLGLKPDMDIFKQTFLTALRVIKKYSESIHSVKNPTLKRHRNI